MAYTFNDHYRAARLLLRVNAFLIGLGLGLLLLIYPRELLVAAGITPRFGLDRTHWGQRPDRAGHWFAVGVNGVGSAAASLLVATISNGAISISLLVAYFEGDMDALHPVGAALLLLIFIVCLLTAVLSAPYIRRRARQY